MNIAPATLADIDELTRLFDLYRQFYQQPPDPALARRYLSARISGEESTIFIATDDADDADAALGFTQLYASFCSVALAPIWILYDLYVDAAARKQGVGTALMNRARQLAEETGAARLELQTAVDNITAQSVYERLGYVRNTQFYGYALTIV